jgi:hypothetical protein
MKKMKFLNIALLLTVFAVISGNLFAQNKNKAAAKKNATKVESFAEGRVLSESDLGFLNSLVTKKSRGAASADLTILMEQPLKLVKYLPMMMMLKFLKLLPIQKMLKK